MVASGRLTAPHVIAKVHRSATRQMLEQYFSASKMDEAQVMMEQPTAVLERERLERERKKEQLEKERLEKERCEKERSEKERLEKERCGKEKERLEKERLEKEKLERDKAEQLSKHLKAAANKFDMVSSERELLDKLVAAAVKREQQTQEKERLERERQQMEAERLQKERLEKERLENQRLECLQKEKLEKERLEKEKIEALMHVSSVSLIPQHGINIAPGIHTPTTATSESIRQPDLPKPALPVASVANQTDQSVKADVSGVSKPQQTSASSGGGFSWFSNNPAPQSSKKPVGPPRITKPEVFMPDDISAALLAQVLCPASMVYPFISAFNMHT